MKCAEPVVTNAAVHAQNLVRHVGDGEQRRRVLDDVSVELFPGQCVALLGPSGAGKTTLLNLLAGLDVADQGVIKAGGFTIGPNDQAARDDYRRNTVGVIFQFYNLISTLTALENVLAGAEAAGLACSDEQAMSLLTGLGLGARANAFPAQLSGGEQQRVAIARALIKSPAVLLADEPTGNLDATTGELVLEQLIEQTRSNGVALLVVTHNEKMAQRFDRVLRMFEGRLVEGA